MEQPIIEIKNVKKKYILGNFGTGTLTNDVRSWWARIRKKEDPNAMLLEENRRVGDDFMALNGVSFNIYKGEKIGIIGSNGAGKSTLLKILSRITSPTSGEVILRGKVTSMLEVGTGFNPEMTGRENIYLNGAILGMTKSEIDDKIDQIIEFSEVSEFIDTPVKRYSSGMYVKLAFSVSAHLDSDILIMDEVLAVGDAAFQKKCLDKMLQTANEQNRTILFVSHSMDNIKKICDRCVMLKDGKLILDGDVNTAVSLYLPPKVVLLPITQETIEPEPIAPPITPEEQMEINNQLILEAKQKYAKEDLKIDENIIKRNEVFKDIHKGKRCFIVGNGLSIRNQDLSFLKNEIVFTMNFAYKLDQFKEIDTNYHLFYDPVMFKINIFSELITENNKPKIFTEYTKGYEFCEKNNKDKTFDINYFFDLFTVDEEQFEIRNDPTAGMTGFHTVAQKAISYAIYMGCTDIYLLGCDCTSILGTVNFALNINQDFHAYEQDKNLTEFFDSNREEDTAKNIEANFFSEAYVFKGYRRILEFCKKNNINLCNATGGGILKSLPIVDYNSLFK